MRIKHVLVATGQVALLAALALAAASPAQGAEWEADFTAADLEFFRPTVSEDPTRLARSVTVGILEPAGRAYVMLSVEGWSEGERVSLRRRVRHLAMPLDELLALVKTAHRGPHRPGALGGPPALSGVFQFYEGFAGFPERSSP